MAINTILGDEDWECLSVIPLPTVKTLLESLLDMDGCWVFESHPKDKHYRGKRFVETYFEEFHRILSPRNALYTLRVKRQLAMHSMSTNPPEIRRILEVERDIAHNGHNVGLRDLARQMSKDCRESQLAYSAVHPLVDIEKSTDEIRVLVAAHRLDHRINATLNEWHRVRVNELKRV